MKATTDIMRLRKLKIAIAEPNTYNENPNQLRAVQYEYDSIIQDMWVWQNQLPIAKVYYTNENNVPHTPVYYIYNSFGYKEVARESWFNFIKRQR